MTNQELTPRSRIAVAGRIAYPELTHLNERGFYACTFIMQPGTEDLERLKQLLQLNVRETFGGDQMPAGAHNPLRDANERKGDGYAFKHDGFRVEGGKVFRCKSKFEVQTFATARRTPCNPADIRGGDECVVEVGVYGYNKQSSGVAISLSSVWLINPGTVRIERGGAAGGSFASYDVSKLNFNEPAPSAEPEKGAFI